MPDWDYKVIALPRDVVVMRKIFRGTGPGDTIAGYVEGVVKENAQKGWEFYRIDAVNIFENPGCLGAMFGRKALLGAYNLLTFRRPLVASSQGSSPSATGERVPRERREARGEKYCPMCSPNREEYYTNPNLTSCPKCGTPLIPVG